MVDCVNPLGFDKQGAYALQVEEGSAAQQAAALLPDSRVTAAFHHLSAVLLQDESIDEIDTDVMVLGEVRADTDIVQALAARIPGMRGVFAGRLRNAHQVESLVANLISTNRRYKAHAACASRTSDPGPDALTAALRGMGDTGGARPRSVFFEELPMPRLAVFALVVCACAVVAAVVAFVEGSFLGIVWVLLAGLTSNMAWYYLRKAKADKASAARQVG